MTPCVCEAGRAAVRTRSHAAPCYSHSQWPTCLQACHGRCTSRRGVSMTSRLAWSRCHSGAHLFLKISGAM